MGYTAEQSMAIEKRNCDLLVSAAAGSGKTAVLVERIIGIITDTKNPVDIDTLLVVTFTKAAASEMRQRISAALVARLNENPEDTHLQRQISLLNKASITTIHSFCQSVVRENCHLIDIDPNFRIADDTTEIKLMQTEIIEELFEELYTGEDADAFHRLVESYSENTGDTRLSELVLEVYNFMQSNPHPTRWLLENAEKFNLKKDIDNTIWAELIKKDISLSLGATKETVLDCIALIEENGTCDGYLNALSCDLDLICRLQQLKTLREIYNAFNELSFERLKNLKSDDLDKELKTRIQNTRNADIKKPLNEIRLDDPEQMSLEITKLYPVIKTLCDVVLLFSKKFSEAKREKVIADFNDLEHFCLEILLDEDNAPSKTAQELQEKFNEIMIDEYQDSNLVQEYILSSISRRNVPNRFMVGDIKQCIYKFRSAQPELFMKKYNSYSLESNAAHVRIDLFKNFRSRKNVLDAINFLFYQLMTEDVGEVCYDESVALNYGSEFPPSESMNCELHIIETNTAADTDVNDDYAANVNDLGNTELEAEMVANRIKKLFDDGFLVCDKGGQRPIEYSDIVILLRSTKTAAPCFYDILTANGIPAFADTSGGFFETVEIMTVMSLLQIIDNPRQDIHLVTVLHSPIYSFDAGELTEIRTSSTHTSFYDCLRHYVSEEDSPDISIKTRLLKFFDDLSHFKKLSVYTPISELLWIIYDETNYFNYVGMLAGGAVRQGNMRALLEKCVQYEEISYKGLFHFIKYIERLEKKSGDFGEAKLLSENENLVRIMSIHKSKGLEFPVVFVSGLGKKFNMQDVSKDLLLHQDLGFGPNYVDYEKRYKKPSIAKMAIRKKIRQENLSEELRILYVAATRAKEKLILTGAANKLDDKISRWARYVSLDSQTLPIHYMLKSQTFLDWIVPAIARHTDGNKIRERADISDTSALLSDESGWDIVFVTREDLVAYEHKALEKDNMSFENIKKLADTGKDYSGQKDEIHRRLSWVYPHSPYVNLPSKVSISEIKRQLMYEETELHETLKNDAPNFKTPLFIKEKNTLSATEKGTALHTALQHIDIVSVRTKADVKKFADELLHKNILTKEEVASLDIDSIISFLNSSLCDRMRKSQRVRKEEPFVLSIPPCEYDPKYKISDRTVLLHGIIDCYFYEDDGIVLVDYKSDYVKDIQSIKDKYKIQLDFYKRAIENSSDKRVKESVLYLFSIGKEVVLYLNQA